MNTPGELKEQMAAKSNEELLDILAKPADWTVEALAVAKEELAGRRVDIQLPAPIEQEETPVFRDLTGLTSFLKFALELAIVLIALDIAFDLLQLYSIGHDVGDRVANLNHGGTLAISYLRLVWDLVTYVTFFCWVYYSNRNIRILGAEGLKFSPGWAVGFFFVPIVNLWKPVLMMEELCKASQNPRNWQEAEPPRFLGFWWATWIFGGFLAFFAGRESLSAGHDIYPVRGIDPSAHFAGELRALFYLLTVTHLVLAARLVLTRKLVLNIQQGQTRIRTLDTDGNPSIQES